MTTGRAVAPGDVYREVSTTAGAPRDVLVVAVLYDAALCRDLTQPGLTPYLAKATLLDESKWALLRTGDPTSPEEA